MVENDFSARAARGGPEKLKRSPAPVKPVESEPVPVDPDAEPIPVDPDSIEPVPVDPDDEVDLAEADMAPVEVIDVLPPRPRVEEEEAIAIVEAQDGEGGPSKIRTRVRSSLETEKKEFARSLNLTGQGATRCRIFHSRVSLGPIEHMQQSINEWLDENQFEVKHVGHFIGVMEGKTPEPNMIVMVWY